MKAIPGHPNYCATEDGLIIRASTGKALKPYPNKWGYSLVSLSHGGTRTRHSVHRLVMLAFRGPSKLHVDHINSVRTDNRLENLSYVTPSENCRLTVARGRKSGYDRIKDMRGNVAEAICIYALCAAGMRTSDAARLFGKSAPTISGIKAGRTWPMAKQVFLNREASK